jgi:hypothetical protein
MAYIIISLHIKIEPLKKLSGFQRGSVVKEVKK